MNDYTVFSSIGKFETQANNPAEARQNFRNEYGFNHIKIDYILDTTNQIEYISVPYSSAFPSGWMAVER